ncbi:MAG TPA: 3-hydroxyacyl-ACP dehydratase FabZ [Gammaproteobacteria bacterium]|nr:3-hydroxyacyl-ACP dehydratase FabZ [Gammaproteobacteria bacterium]
MTDDKTIDIKGILERLPHRFPFLMVDRVRSVTAGKSIVALKNVTANEAHFEGHFPGHPVMPGVLIIEALAQAAGVLAWESVTDEERLWILYLVGIDKTRFKQPVMPGDQLVLNVELVQRRRNLWRFEGRAEVDGKVVAATDLLLADGPKP